MEAIYTFFEVVPAFVPSLVSVGSRLIAILFIYFASKYRNGNPGIKWYILAFFFPFIVTVVFLSKRKELGSPEMKVCPICKAKYPTTFVSCYKCNAELLEYDENKKKAQKAVAIISAVLFFALWTFSFAYSVMGALLPANGIFSDGITDHERSYGVSSDGFYYDRNGEKYTSFFDVPFYSKDGEKFTYSYATERYEGKNHSYSIYDCLVDENGFIVPLSGDDLDYHEPKNGSAYFTDSDSNKYYDITWVGWTEDGTLLADSKFSVDILDEYY